LDIEWLLSTLFDASLLSLEPPYRRLFFVSAGAIFAGWAWNQGLDKRGINRLRCTVHIIRPVPIWGRWPAASLAF